ncbi:MAG: methyltransferase domain-containing protein [Phycisphaerales bacterium]|nr:methyltransferase domain-containing protein [Phycisphaerales bacterium]
MKPAQGAALRRAVRVGDAEARERSRRRLQRRRRLRAFLQTVRHLLGMRNAVTVDQVRYTERDAVPLARALASEATGSKDYLVRFPDNSGMRIRCQHTRIYADLMPDPRLPAYEALDRIIKPGMRVLELAAGTGAGAALLARTVGPSGGVVALERDGESVRFARRRYPAPHLAIERGGIESLRGELDGSFDAIVCPAGELDEPTLGELCRCLAGGGCLAIWGRAEDADQDMLFPIRDWSRSRLGQGMTVFGKPAPDDPDAGASNLDQ